MAIELINGDERTHGNPLTEIEYKSLNLLWKEKDVQDFYLRRAEYHLNDSTK